MPYKNPKKAKEWHQQHYQKHKRRHRNLNYRWVREHPKEFKKIQKRYLRTKKGLLVENEVKKIIKEVLKAISDSEKQI